MRIASFPDLTELAKVMTQGQLAAHYNSPRTTVYNHLKRLGIKAKEWVPSEGSHAPIPMPDIVERAKEMTRAELRAYYKCGETTLDERLAKLGIKAFAKPRAIRVARAPKPQRKPAKARFNPFVAVPVYTPRASSQADRAMDHLRKLGPVWRCTEDGVPNPDANFFRRGSVVLSEADLIALAVRKGFA